MNTDGRGKAPSGVPPLAAEDVKFIAVHCSATGPSVNWGAADIDRSHRLRGFTKIGYHYVIKRDGAIEKGRALNERGAHIEGFNHCSVGVCLIGGVDGTKKMNPQANFTEDQLEALRHLVNYLLGCFPGAKVQGHRDFPGVKKACPSFDVKAFLNQGVVVP